MSKHPRNCHQILIYILLYSDRCMEVCETVFFPPTFPHGIWRWCCCQPCSMSHSSPWKQLGCNGFLWLKEWEKSMLLCYMRNAASSCWLMLGQCCARTILSTFLRMMELDWLGSHCCALSGAGQQTSSLSVTKGLRHLVSRTRLSHWVVDAIQDVYKEAGRLAPVGVLAHSTWGLAIS